MMRSGRRGAVELVMEVWVEMGEVMGKDGGDVGMGEMMWGMVVWVQGVVVALIVV
jgi:hypothetical protein